MKIPVVDLILLVDLLIAIPVAIHSRKIGRRSPAFDFVVAFFIPIIGPIMYISSIRMGLVPGQQLPLEAPDVPKPEPKPARSERMSEPSPTLMAELTAEVRKLRSELEAAQAEIQRLKGG
jgi:hypothetical protein